MAKSASLKRKLRYGEDTGPLYGPQEEGLPSVGDGGTGPPIPEAGSRIGGVVRKAARTVIGAALGGVVGGALGQIGGQAAGQGSGLPLGKSQAELSANAPKGPPAPTMNSGIAPRPTPLRRGEGTPEAGGPEGSPVTFDKLWNDFKKNLKAGMRVT